MAKSHYVYKKSNLLKLVKFFQCSTLIDSGYDTTLTTPVADRSSSNATVKPSYRPTVAASSSPWTCRRQLNSHVTPHHSKPAVNNRCITTSKQTNNNRPTFPPPPPPPFKQHHNGGGSGERRFNHILDDDDDDVVIAPNGTNQFTGFGLDSTQESPLMGKPGYFRADTSPLPTLKKRPTKPRSKTSKFFPQ